MRAAATMNAQNALDSFPRNRYVYPRTRYSALIKFNRVRVPGIVKVAGQIFVLAGQISWEGDRVDHELENFNIFRTRKREFEVLGFNSRFQKIVSVFPAKVAKEGASCLRGEKMLEQW